MKWTVILTVWMGLGIAWADSPDDDKPITFKQQVHIGFQPSQFRVVNDTPNLTDLQDGEVVRYSSNTVNGIMWRSDREIYSVSGSCVTIRR